MAKKVTLSWAVGGETGSDTDKPHFNRHSNQKQSHKRVGSNLAACSEGHAGEINDSGDLLLLC